MNRCVLCIYHGKMTVIKIIGSLVNLYTLDFDFSRFGLRLSKWPKSLALRLLEVGQPNLFGRKPIAEVFVPVPGR